MRYCSSALQTPPSAVPKLTPIRSCGFSREYSMCASSSQLRRHDCELSVAVESFQAVRGKKHLWVPITNLAGRAHAEGAGIETCDVIDTAFFRQNCVPKILAPLSDAGDWANSGDDSASMAHAVTLSVFASTYDFMQRSVLFAM